MSIFTKVRGLRPKKNAFNLSHQIAQTQDIGQIMPCYVHDGILPNSREKLFATSVVRFQALLSPLQHKVDLYAHFWYVPYRIIDKQFPKFISGQMERDGITYDCPTVDLGAVARCMYQIHNAVFPLGVEISIQSYFELILSSSGLLCYLNYPGYGRDQMPDFSDWQDFSNYRIMTRLNVRRLQAYFFIIAQNYINENFTLKYNYVGIQEIDLIAELFNFALGDFELLNNAYDTSLLSNVPNTTVCDICLAKILYCLAFRNNEFILNPNCSFPHAWKKDYFTSALPFVQLGEEVTVPIGRGTASVTQASMDIENLNLQNPKFKGPDGEPILPNGSQIITKNADGTLGAQASEFSTNDISTVSGESGRLEMAGMMDLDNIEAGITINELRAANALQSLKEAFARYGTRFQEWLKGFWNQNSSDRSQQLPEWLGGFKVPVQISEIEQTSATASTELENADSPLGTLAGKGMGIGGKKVFSRHFEEPGVIIGLCFLQPKAVYPTSGIDRFLLKTNNLFDYLTPKMEHLGEQEVYRGELFMSQEPDENKEIFGYQSRYAEYKQIQSKYRGQFADVLSFWHLGRQFADAPVLGKDFVYIDSKTMKRPFAVQTIDQETGPGESDIIDISNCMLWFNFDVKYIAPMSRFGTPALLN